MSRARVQYVLLLRWQTLDQKLFGTDCFATHPSYHMKPHWQRYKLDARKAHDGVEKYWIKMFTLFMTIYIENQSDSVFYCMISTTIPFPRLPSLPVSEGPI